MISRSQLGRRHLADWPVPRSHTPAPDGAPPPTPSIRRGRWSTAPGRCHPPAGPFQYPPATLASTSPASFTTNTALALVPPPAPGATASNVALPTAQAQHTASAGSRRGGARLSDDNAQPRVGGTRHVGARRPRPLPGAAVTAPVRGPVASRARLPGSPALRLARSCRPARWPAVSVVAVPAPRTRGRIMSSPPEGKLETKAGHPPAGTDSFPLSVLPRGARAGSNPRARARARGAEGAAGSGGRSGALRPSSARAAWTQGAQGPQPRPPGGVWCRSARREAARVPDFPKSLRPARALVASCPGERAAGATTVRARSVVGMTEVGWPRFVPTREPEAQT